MTRRAVRRRYAILGALHEHGPQYAADLATAVGRKAGTLYPDLTELELTGRIIGEWDNAPEGQRRLRWRITTAAERTDDGLATHRRFLTERGPRHDNCPICQATA